MHRSRSTLVALGSALAVVALAGCGTSDPATTPTPTSTSTSPTPTPDPAEAAAQRDVDEANAALTEFVAQWSAVAQAGYVDGSPLDGLLSGDLRGEMVDAFGDYAGAGIRNTGPFLLDGTTVVEQTPAPDGSTGAVVVLDACLDISQSDMVDASGTSVLDPDRATRYVVTYRTVQEADGRWTVNKSEPHTDRPC